MGTSTEEYRVVPMACPHNCGGSCLLNAHVRNGVIERISGDEADENASVPQLRGCARGRAYRHRVYAPDRLRYPMIRNGQRGEGRFKRVSWDKALDLVAERMGEIKKEHGPSAVLNMSASGTYPACLHNTGWVHRLLNMWGGQTQLVGTLSNEGGSFASRYTYGTYVTSSDMDDLLNSELIIMWGWNPAASIHSTNTTWYLRQAKENGAKIIVIDPRHTESAAALADQWIPVRPGSDAALAAAMANVILEERLEDKVFLDKFTYGFQDYAEYVSGEEDGVPKTPRWAEQLTGVKADTITRLARELAGGKPAALMTGMGPGRTPYGEQFFRTTAALAAMTGNVGVPGGSSAIPGGGISMLRLRGIPTISPNPAGCTLNPSNWADAILKGKEGGYPSDIKMVYSMAGNLLNQVGNINKGIEALKSLEFMVMQEQFMTPTARFADVLLPATTSLEREDVFNPWGMLGRYAVYSHKVIEPMYECKNDLEILTLLAKKLGIEGYNDKSDHEWLSLLVADSEMEEVEEFKRSGAYRINLIQPNVALQKNIQNPGKNPFRTPTGKIEIYSSRLAEMDEPEIPPIPKYIPGWESNDCSEAGDHPLLLITPQSKRRCHSTYDNIPLVSEIEPNTIWINPQDASHRGVENGDPVMVRNERGRTVIQAKVTERIMPGVVSIDEGRWFTPDENGTDTAGSANTLVLDGPSPGGAARFNGNRVEVEKA